MREKVEKFADEMELQLQLNEHKGGWDGEDPDFLLAKLEGHVNLLSDALEMLREVRGNSAGEDAARAAILDNAADVANFAMMVADVTEALE